MARTITLGTCTAGPGESAKGYIPVGTNPDGSPIQIPVWVVNGNDDGPVLCVDGCVHGDEHEGPQAILQFMRSLDPASLRGAVIGVPVVTVPAFNAMTRHIPQDHLTFDPNRVYPGSPGGSITQRIAHAHLTGPVAAADLYISLHSGASYLYWMPEIVLLDEHGPSLELATAMGAGWELLAQHQPFPSTGLEAAVKQGQASIVVEVGGRGSLPDQLAANVELLVAGLRNVLARYGMLNAFSQDPKSWKLLKQTSVKADRGGLVFAEPGIRLGARVEEGQLLFRVTDLLGNEVEAVRSPDSGMITAVRTYPSAHPGHSLAYVGRTVRELSR